MDKSLDDIIRERNFSKPTNRFGRGRGGGQGGSRGRGGRGGNASANRGRDGGGPRGGGNMRGQNRGRGGNRGRGNWQQQQQQQQQQRPAQQEPITDARQKLIQKAHQGDARDRLAQKARRTDARLKLTSRRQQGGDAQQQQQQQQQQPQQQPQPKGQVGPEQAGAPLARTVPNVQTGSTQFTVRNPSRVQNKTQITIRNTQRTPQQRTPQRPPQRNPQRESGSSPPLSRGSSRQNEALLAAASTLRVTKAVPQPQKRPVVDYPHFDDDLISRRMPNPPKVQRRMPESPLTQDRAWAQGLSARLHTTSAPIVVPQGTRLIISNLQISVTEDDIKELFGAIGELMKARMLRQGLAEVVYRNRTEALQAINTYHNRELDGKPMVCKLDTSTIPEAAGHRTTPNTLSDRFKTMRPENNPKLPFETALKGGLPAGIDPGVVHKALFKKGTSAASQKPVVFTVKI